MTPCLAYYSQIKKVREIQEKIRNLASGVDEISPDELLKLREKCLNGQLSKYNFPGVYAIFNKTMNKYYVGQSKEVLNRIFKHFTAKGNGDIYANYKYGCEFTIKMLD